MIELLIGTFLGFGLGNLIRPFRVWAFNYLENRKIKNDEREAVI